MDFIQTLRRLRQSIKNDDYWNIPEIHIAILKKLYAKNGFELVNTCSACPEQYDVFKDGEQVAYLRLRHGHFTARYPDVYGDIIYEAYPIGDGIFDNNERYKYMSKALTAIKYKLT